MISQSYRKLYKDIEGDIRREGRSVLCIGGEEDLLPFARARRTALSTLR
jgi:hypothetical protein